MKVPEKYRIRTNHPMASTSSDGNNGAFDIPLKGVFRMFVIASDGLGWEHVSVTVYQKNKAIMPTWDHMCLVKDLFWDKMDCVIQYHPPETEYISNHPKCLHLWKPIGVELPLPPYELVGTKEFEIK